jgi:hypothetical protein
MIKYGDKFNKKEDVMHLFGLGISPFGAGRVIIDGVLSAWFPRRAIRVEGGLTAPNNIGWLNIIEDDEEEITEIDLAETPTGLADKPGGHRLVFVRGTDAPCRYIGLYTLAHLTPSLRTRVFARLSRDFLLAPSNLIAAPAAPATAPAKPATP